MKYIKSELENAIIGADSVPDVVRNLGLDPKKGNVRQNVERGLKRHGFDISNFSSVKRISKDRYNEEILKQLVESCFTMKEILLELDLVPITTNYKTLKKYLIKYNINFSKFINNKFGKTVADYSKENLEKIVPGSYSFAEVKRKLGLTTTGRGNDTLRKYIKKYKIDISHFNPYLSKRNNKFKPLSDILIKNSTYVSTHNLKNRLYKEGIKEKICEMCGQDEIWNKKQMSLILDHINGINNDNRLVNLRIVCPNCNATLPTHCGKNKSKNFKNK